MLQMVIFFIICVVFAEFLKNNLANDKVSTA